jgi:hypothetical protein
MQIDICVCRNSAQGECTDREQSIARLKAELGHKANEFADLHNHVAPSTLAARCAGSERLPER